MLQRLILVLVLLLLCCCGDVAAATGVYAGGGATPDNSEKKGGGLACFVVEQDGDEKEGPVCDEVCSAKDAVCVSVENFAPGGCSTHIGKDVQCRCCRAAR
jgi:hypothetical protein